MPLEGIKKEMKNNGYIIKSQDEVDSVKWLLFEAPQYLGIKPLISLCISREDGLIQIVMETDEKGFKPIVAAVKIGDLMKEKYGEASTDGFIGNATYLEGDYTRDQHFPLADEDHFNEVPYKILSREKATLNFKRKVVVHYVFDYRTKRGKKEFRIYSNNRGAFVVESFSPKYKKPHDPDQTFKLYDVSKILNRENETSTPLGLRRSEAADLLGNDYGVEKWPKFLGKGIEWGMASKDATKKMAEKGYKLDQRLSGSPPMDKIFPEILTYKGKFLSIPAQVGLKFSPDDKLLEIQILMGLYFYDEEDGKVGLSTIRQGNSRIGSEFEIRSILEKMSKSLETGLKIRDLIVKQCGEPTEEQFIQAQRTFAETWYDGDGEFLTKEEALASKFNVHYTVRYTNKKTENDEEHDYIRLYANNFGSVTIKSNGPDYYDFARKLRGK